MPKPLAIHKEATDIIAPLITAEEPIINPLRITVSSPKQYRRAIFRFAQFFQREFDYDFLQYGWDGNENDKDHIAFLWVLPEAVPFVVDFRVPCIGATCFRLRRLRDGQDSLWAMQWIWFHPYHRRKGLLSEIWPSFKEEFGDFICEPPLSIAMRQFLKKHNYNIDINKKG